MPGLMAGDIVFTHMEDHFTAGRVIIRTVSRGNPVHVAIATGEDLKVIESIPAGIMEQPIPIYPSAFSPERKQPDSFTIYRNKNHQVGIKIKEFADAERSRYLNRGKFGLSKDYGKYGFQSATWTGVGGGGFFGRPRPSSSRHYCSHLVATVLMNTKNHGLANAYQNPKLQPHLLPRELQIFLENDCHWEGFGHLTMAELKSLIVSFV